jgi:hypothetical protein
MMNCLLYSPEWGMPLAKSTQNVEKLNNIMMGDEGHIPRRTKQ